MAEFQPRILHELLSPEIPECLSNLQCVPLKSHREVNCN